MHAFIVELANRPGEIARMTGAIAQKGINITGFAGATCGDSGSVVMLTNDETGTRRALQDGHFSAREIEVVPAALADAPGTLAEAARRLADAGVNIEAVLATGMSGGRITVAFATDNPTKARSALGESVLAGTAR